MRLPIVAVLGTVACFLALTVPSSATQSDIASPAGSVGFGRQVTVLPNGNMVILDLKDPANGAAYLYSAAGTQISKVTNVYGDGIHVVVLTNGNYLLVAPGWSGAGVSAGGMVAWGSATTGISGSISSANALVGSSENDRVGHPVITPLSNGNYVVGSYRWSNNGAMFAGAATWGSGTAGVNGVVSTANSLIGTNVGDSVGAQIVALTNGNYVVLSHGGVDVGAATWGNGTTGVKGTVSTANSLMGTTGDDGDFSYVVALSNGNYVYGMPYRDNGSIVDAGAVIWANGATGRKGAVTNAMALVGTKSGNFVGYPKSLALPNGNYVVQSIDWEDGAAEDLGAITWANGSTGLTGSVSRSNSLVGSKSFQYLGWDPEYRFDGLVALKNSNYVVVSPRWSDATHVDQGAITWGSGSSATVGVVSAANSMVGRKSEDMLGLGVDSTSVAVLSNGNYVVSSPQWHNDDDVPAGAVTWLNGSGPSSGIVDASNSLVSGIPNGGAGVAALANGNFVAFSNGLVWGNGTTGITGTTGPETPFSDSYSFIIPIPDGNYLICTPGFSVNGQESVGAVTWANGSMPLAGAPSTESSLYGSTAQDSICDGLESHAYSDGQFLIASPSYDSGAIWDAEAFTLGNGPMKGPIDASNSVIGTQIAGGNGSTGEPGLYADYDVSRHRAVIGKPSENKVTFFTIPAAATSLSIADAKIVEGNSGTKTANFIVSLNAPLATAVTFNVATSNGTASSGSDFVALSSTAMSIPAGTLSKAVSVVINGDASFEPDETFNVNVTNVSGTTLFDGHAVATILNDDVNPTPSIYVTHTQVMEGNSGSPKADFQIVLSAPAPAPVTFTASTKAGIAQAGIDFVSKTQTITIPTGGVGATFSVDIIPDTINDQGENFQVELTNISGALVGNALVDCWINDDDWNAGATLPVLSVSDATIAEGNAGTKTATITVSLDRAVANDVFFDFDAFDGSAFAGSDYQGLSLPGQRIPAGSTSATFTVTVKGDTVPEMDERFYVGVANYWQNADSIKSWGTVTVTNDDSGGGGGTTPSLSIGDVSIAEGNSGTKTATFTVQLSAPSSSAVGFDIATSDGTATAGSDYVAQALVGQSIPAGNTSATFSVTINGDTAVESDETFNVAVANVTGATVADGSALGTITNDDSGGGGGGPTLSISDVSITEGNLGTKSANFKITLSAAASSQVRFDIATANGTAIAGSDYTAKSQVGMAMAIGVTTKNFTVPIIGDTVQEPDENFTVSVSNVTGATLADGLGVGTITNDDTGGGGSTPSLSIADVSVSEGNSGTKTANFTVQLSAAASSAVSFDLATSNGTATAGSDYVALALAGQSIAAGATSKSFAVTINGDTAVEPDETFTLSASNVSGATVADGSAIGTITNDDSASLPTLSVTDVTVAEGNSGTKTATFKVQLSAASASAVTYDIATANGTATAGSDYTAQSLVGQNIPAGATSADFVVTIAGDTTVEPDESFNVNVSNVAGATIADGSGLGTITNDDSAGGGPTLTIADVSVVEGNNLSRQAVFTVKLSAPSASPVTYDIATANGTAIAPTDYTAKSLTAQTIPAGATTDRFAVPVKGDLTVESDETFTVTVSNVVGATVGDGVAIGTITNDDAAALSVARLDTRGLYDDVDDGNRAPLLPHADYVLLLADATHRVCTLAGGPTVVGVDNVENLAVLHDLADAANLTCGRRYVAVAGNRAGTERLGFLVDIGKGKAGSAIEVVDFAPAKGSAAVLRLRVAGSPELVTVVMPELASGAMSVAQSQALGRMLSARRASSPNEFQVVLAPAAIAGLRELRDNRPVQGMVAPDRVYVSEALLRAWPNARVEKLGAAKGGSTPVLLF